MSIIDDNKEIQFCEEEWSISEELEDLKRKYLEYYSLDNEDLY